MEFLVERKTEMEFDTWMEDVNDCVKEQSGLDIKDLPDFIHYQDLFDEGIEPEEAARKALEESGFMDFAF